MTTRIRTALLALLGLGLVGPATAGMLYVPVAINETVGDVVFNTELWVTNPTDGDVLGFFATFLPAGLDGTVRPAGAVPPAYFVAPGQSVRFADLVPGGGGMLEIEGSPQLIVSAKLTSRVTGFGNDLEPVDLPILTSKNLLPAGTNAWLQGFEKEGGERFANLGIVNLGQVATTCNLDVRQADGLLMIQNVNFQVAPLTRLQFNDALALLGVTNVAWGARVRVACDQNFWAYTSLYDLRTGGLRFSQPAVTPTDSALPKPGGDDGGGDGGGDPVDPADPNAVVFELPGNFLTCNSCGNWQFDMPFGSTRRFRKIVLDFDVFVKQWDSNRTNGFHCVFWLNNGSSWSNMMGYLNSKGTQGKMTFQVNYGVGHETTQYPGMQTGTTYHVHYEYDMVGGEVWYQVKNGSSVRVSGSHNTSANDVSSSKMFIQFGTQIAEGPEARTQGWKWYDFRAQFIP